MSMAEEPEYVTWYGSDDSAVWPPKPSMQEFIYDQTQAYTRAITPIAEAMNELVKVVPTIRLPQLTQTTACNCLCIYRHPSQMGVCCGYASAEEIVRVRYPATTVGMCARCASLPAERRTSLIR